MTNTLTIERSRAVVAHKNASATNKGLLEDLLGKEHFERGNPKDWLKTFEDACEALGIDPTTIVSQDDAEYIAAIKKLEVVVMAANQGWVPDWNNYSQYKYWPYFYMDKPGFRFGVSVCVCDASASYVGSRLCFKSRELSDYIGQQFVDLYKAFMA